MEAIDNRYTQRRRRTKDSIGKTWEDIEGLRLHAVYGRSWIYLTEQVKHVINEDCCERYCIDLRNLEDLGKPINALFVPYQHAAKDVFLSAGGYYGNEPSVASYHGNVCIVAKWAEHEEGEDDIWEDYADDEESDESI